MFRSRRFPFLLLVVAVCLVAHGQQKSPSIYPESTIANVSLEGFLPDGRHYSAVVYLSGSFSSSYYAPVTLPNPNSHVSDGWTNDKRFFVFAEAAFGSSKADEIELPTRKELSDAALSDMPSKYRGQVVLVISPLKGKAQAKAFMRVYDRKFVGLKLRELDELLMTICDKRVR